MKEDIIVYIDIMVQRGFPHYHFELLGAPVVSGRRLRISDNATYLKPHAKNYVRENDIDLTILRYEDVSALSTDYVHSNVNPQFKEGEDDAWHDETYDLWTDVFVSLTEVACLELFLTNQEKFLSQIAPKNI